MESLDCPKSLSSLPDHGGFQIRMRVGDPKPSMQRTSSSRHPAGCALRSRDAAGENPILHPFPDREYSLQCSSPPAGLRPHVGRSHCRAEQSHSALEQASEGLEHAHEDRRIPEHPVVESPSGRQKLPLESEPTKPNSRTVAWHETTPETVGLTSMSSAGK
jgi:hypothetical protein